MPEEKAFEISILYQEVFQHLVLCHGEAECQMFQRA